MMKYLTLDNWIADQRLGGGEPPSFRAAALYRAYLESIKHRLPTALQQLSDEYCIHDACLRSLRVDLAQARVSLRLDAGDVTMREGRDISIHYEGVAELHTTADPDKGLPGPHGYGDLGYDEVEFVADDMLEHRFVFSSASSF
jgi:hypothetical protein